MKQRWQCDASEYFGVQGASICQICWTRITAVRTVCRPGEASDKEVGRSIESLVLTSGREHGDNSHADVRQNWIVGTAHGCLQI